MIRTDKYAQMAADAGLWIHDGLSVYHTQSFVPTVPAGKIASPAAYTFLAVKPREKLSLSIEILQLGYIFHPQALKL